MIKDPEQKEYIYGDNETLQGRELPSSYYHATGIFLIGIICIAILGNFPDLLPHFPNAKGKMAAISMTTVIQMVMLFVSALILFACKTKAKEVGNSQVFRAGIVALVSVYGVAWMADTYFASHMGVLKTFLGSVVTQHPWTYGLVLFFTSKLVNSQGGGGCYRYAYGAWSGHGSGHGYVFPSCMLRLFLPADVSVRPGMYRL